MPNPTSDAAPSWMYVAYDKQGYAHRGTLTAESYTAAFNNLTKQLLTPAQLSLLSEKQTFLNQVMTSGVVFEFPGSVARARMTFWRILRQHQKAGRDAVAAISAYLSDCPSPIFASVLRDMLWRMTTNGITLAEAMRTHTEFRSDHVEMIDVSEGGKTRLSVLDAIILDESNARRLRATNIADRADSYITYVATIATLIFLPRWYIPAFVKSSQDALGPHAVSLPWLDAMGKIGDLLGDWPTYFILLAIVLAARWVLDKIKANPEAAEWLESLRWQLLPQTKDLDVTEARIRALEIIASMRTAAINEKRILDAACRSSASPNFSKMLAMQRDAVPDEVSFEESFTRYPLWGGEIASLLGASKAGSWTGEAQEILGDMREEAESKRRLNAVMGTFGHAAFAFTIVAVIVTIIFISQTLVTIAISQT